MASSTNLFDIEQLDGVVVVTPHSDLRELDYRQIEHGAAEVLAILRSGAASSVVMDFHRTDYYGSTALAFFLNVWKEVRNQGGHMAFCHVSPHEMQILRLMRLETLWSICDTRDEALAAVGGAK